MSLPPHTESDDFNYFQSLFENARQNAMLLMDETGKIRIVNAAFTNAFGYTTAEIIGQPLSILFTPEDRQRQLPETELQKVLEQGQASDNNFLVDKYGGLTWVSGESVLVKNAGGKQAVLKVIQNINSQKVSENSIIGLNSFNESILRSIADVVMVLNEQLNIVKFNSAFEKVFTPSLAISDGTMGIAELIQPFDAESGMVRKIRQLIDSKISFDSYIVEIETGQFGKKIFEFTASIISHPGMADTVLLVAHDITLQKQAEIEREDIIGFVAHELRNPLANIVLCNEMMTQLIKDNQSNQIGEYLQRSKNNVMRLNKMIGELYDVTKFNSGKFQLEKSEFDFEEMVEEALDTLEVLHPDYSIIVEGESPEPVYGDRYRLIQVVTNFLSNGIKYSNNNTKVFIHLQQENGWVTVSVKDEGLGIPSRQLPFIFARFFRSEKTRNLEGMGLGLYLCNRIIEAHNGKIWVESEEGKGSSFYFSIPFNNL